MEPSKKMRNWVRVNGRGPVFSVGKSGCGYYSMLALRTCPLVRAGAATLMMLEFFGISKHLIPFIFRCRKPA